MNALLRPLRWPLNVQNALLAVVILAVTTVLTGRLVWRSGERALLDHEIVDLKDETNLRSREFRLLFGGISVVRSWCGCGSDRLTAHAGRRRNFESMNRSPGMVFATECQPISSIGTHIKSAL